MIAEAQLLGADECVSKDVASELLGPMIDRAITRNMVYREHASLKEEDPRDQIKPVFESRYPFWYDALDADWSARNKCNGSARLDERRGGKLIYQGVHTFNRFIPASTYFDDHPEYFSLVQFIDKEALLE